ncbi:hypothetical protein ACPYO6_14210 [Georgenia sp. Z1344]|uniref:hypothetical protein n=1 Tax=Georgenia sp. Z1344 TaxID=3416706 RepID=UPI003CE68F30
MNVRVDTDDLRTDASHWEAFSTDTFTPTANQVDDLTMPEGALPGAAIELGVKEAYEAVRSTVDTLAGDGPTAFTAVASVLRRAADIYEDTDYQSEIDFSRV